MRGPAWPLPVLTVATFVAAAAFASPASAAGPTFREFTPAGAPLGIASGPDGNLWATSAADDSLVRSTPGGASEQFSDGILSASDPTSITAGPDGNMWFIEATTNRVVKIPTSGVLASGFAVPTPNSGLAAIAAGADGNLWFTESAGNQIGRVTTSGVITEFPVPTANSQPLDMTAGPDGDLWFTMPGANAIGEISTSGQVTERVFFRADAKPSAITAGPDGNLWFSESGAPFIGQISTGGAAVDFPISAVAGAITAGPDGNVWFALTAEPKIGRITPTGAVTEFPVPGMPAGSSLLDLRPGPDGNLWATTTTGKLLRITTGVAPPRFTDPAAIKVPGTGDKGIADPYPATIEAEGLQGTVTKVTVRLNGVHHGFASDLHVQLVGPQGQRAVLMANPTDRLGDVGLAQPDVFDGDVLTFADGAPAPERRPTTGLLAPFDPGFLLQFETAGVTPPGPVNLPPPPANLATFNGTNPNGTWKLFVVDDDDHAETTRPTTGVIAGGWSLDIQTSGPPPVQLPAPDPVTVTVPGPTQTVVAQGPGPAPAGAGQAPAPDTTRPTLKLGKLPASTTLAGLRRGVAVAVTPSETVTLDATLEARARKATIARAAFPLALAEQTRSLTTTGATLRLKPDAQLLGRPRRAFTVRLRLRAADAAGNRTTVTRTITVRPR